MAATLPTGVEIRNNKICIWFLYRGKRCREILKGWANNPANIKKAGNLRALITSEITLNQFDYAVRFPSSSAITKFDTTDRINTWGELVSQWCSHREIELTANTLRKTKSQLKTISKIIGDETPLSSIAHGDILSYRRELLKGQTCYSISRRSNKIGRSVRTVNNYTSLICQLLRYAHRSHYIALKPYEGISKLQKGKTAPDPLTQNEFSKLKLSLRGQQLNLWQVAVFTGLRHGELAALAWEDINLETGEIRVSRNLTAMGIFGPPKTRAGIRTVTLLQPAIDALKSQQALTALQPKTIIELHLREYGKTEHQSLHFVFMPRVKKGVQKPYYSLSTLGARWNAAIKRADIRRRNPYHTRHTYACWMMTAGANPSFIASQMGHENAQMVYEIYSAWMQDMNSDQISMLNKKLAL